MYTRICIEPAEVSSSSTDSFLASSRATATHDQAKVYQAAVYKIGAHKLSSLPYVSDGHQ